MGKNFIKFKKRAFRIRLLKSILVGFSLGTLTSGALILLSKFEITSLEIWLSSVIGAAAAAALFLALFFILRTSDVRLARLLDRELSLDERVETMVQFKNEDSTIYRLQREDTDKRLSDIPVRVLKAHRLWICVVTLILGIGLLTFSALYTIPEEEPPIVEEEEFKITSLQIKAMNELIATVEESEMASPYRENVVLVLTELLDDLMATYTVREKNERVAAAMDAVLLETDASSAALELMNLLWLNGSDSSRTLAKVLNYYDWPNLDEWDKFTSLAANFRGVFIHPEANAENPDIDKINSETELLLFVSSSEISKAIDDLKIGDSDSLAAVLKRLALSDEVNEDGTRVYGLKKLSTLLGTSGYAFVSRELDSTLSALSPDIFAALSAHKESTDTGEYAVKRLADIFDCAKPRFERPTFLEIEEESGSGTEEDAGGGGGAIGSGTEYGSDDLVLDPYTNTYVEYGVIIERYYALMFGGLENGGYTDAEKDAMEKYFAILYGGFDEGE